VYDPNHSRLIFKRFEPSPLYTKIVEARFSLSTRRYLRILWVIAVLVVIISSLLPSGSFPMRALGKLGIGDKLLHATAYAVLGFLPALHERRPTVAASLLSAIVIGIGLEFAQRLSPGRSFEIADMAADICGVLCGLIVALPLRAQLAPLNWN
jgi:VanZ family protein